MPISFESAKISVDFPYNWETPSGEVITISMRFLHTEDGPVLQIFNGPDEPIELPAMMFLEVAEFLVRQNILKGISNPNNVTSRSGVPLPSIQRKPKDEPIQPRKIGIRQPRPTPPQPEVDPVSSFTPPTEEEIEELTQDETEELNPENVQSLKEKMEARGKVNLDKMKQKKIKHA